MTSTLWGFEYYYNKRGESLFDNINLPDGIDKEVLVNTIMLESSELEMIYSNGDFLKVAIQNWFCRKYPMIERFINATNLEYNPIENYNRVETWKDKINGGKTLNSSKEGSVTTTSSNSEDVTDTTHNVITHAGTISVENDTTETTAYGKTDTTTYNTTDTVSTSNINTQGAQSNSTEDKVSAFNSNTYSPEKQSTNTLGARIDSDEGTTNDKKTGTEENKFTGSDTVTTSGSNVQSFNNNDSTSGTDTINKTGSNNSSITNTESTEDTDTHNDELTHEGNISGNIGVTTSQQMLKSELELWAKIDIYKEIATQFVDEFCILIY